MMIIDPISYSDIKLKVIYEDNNFLVIDKPSGLLVHPTKYEKKNTLIDWLLDKYPEIKNVGLSAEALAKAGQKDRPGIVHRLDKDVSGLMVIAKTQLTYEHLIKEFGRGKVKKKYLALVYGRPPAERGIIDLPIGRTRKGILVAIRSRKKIKFEKPALTKYRVLRVFKNFSLLEVETLTGRIHQIRLHLKSIGCPILGDAPRKFEIRNPKFEINSDRIFLHASYLGFYDPDGLWREFRSELPEELKRFIENLI